MITTRPIHVTECLHNEVHVFKAKGSLNCHVDGSTIAVTNIRDVPAISVNILSASINKQ